MNKKILCVLPLSLLVVACGQQQVSTVPGCKTHPVLEQCSHNSGNGTTPFVNVNLMTWKVSPPNVCVTAGDTLEIRFRGRDPELNSIATVPYGNSEFWLVGSNSSDKETITLKVPEGPEKGDFFNFAILTKSYGCVDPRATYD